MIGDLGPAPRGNFAGSVIANATLCREHYRLTIRLTHFPPSAPGQFVQLQCRDSAIESNDHSFEWSADGTPPKIIGREFSGQDAFLRRPFSIASRRDLPDGESEIDIIGREVGAGTRFLAGLSLGDSLSVIGPLGNTFALPAAGETALLVGGGVGIPPMIYLAQALSARVNSGRVDAYAFAGATTRDLMALTIRDDPAARHGPFHELASGFGKLVETPFVNATEFAALGISSFLSTDDGTVGAKGYVTDSLVRFLDLVAKSAGAGQRFIIYTCGPEPMMKRVQQIADSRGIRSQIAVERAMACGMGTCQSCCVRIKKPDPAAPPLPGAASCYRLACTDGPVFAGDELLW